MLLRGGGRGTGSASPAFACLRRAPARGGGGPVSEEGQREEVVLRPESCLPADESGA